jgi:hypothetical protein
MMKLTEDVWVRTEEKWSPNHDHNLRCLFCDLFFGVTPICTNIQGHECPLRSHNSCCDGLWGKWDEEGTEVAAADVLAFIKQKHEEWKREQHE